MDKISFKFMCITFLLFVVLLPPSVGITFAKTNNVQECRYTQKNPIYITDKLGRALMLHGVNVSHDTKFDPLNVGSTTEQDIQRLSKDWGFNFTRFLLQWDGIEPMKGFYDEAYFERVEERLDWYADAGIHVLLDMHQDLFLDNGIPKWAQRTDGWIKIKFRSWSLNALSPDALRAIDNFYNPTGRHADVQEHFVLAWQEVVRRFKDHPAVIGYDLLNEPSNGTANIFTFERKKLGALYSRVIAAIREIDNDTWIFVAPQSATTNSGLPSFMGPIRDTREGESRIGYAPHYYQISGGYNERKLFQLFWSYFRSKELNKQQGPLIIGEFGGQASLAEEGEKLMASVANMADCMAAGWAFWNYHLGSQMIDENGEETKVMDALVRTYAPRIAGAPVRHIYNPETKVFTLEFKNKEGVSGSTHISIPPRHYPNGWRMEVSDDTGTWSSNWDDQKNVLSVTTNPGQSWHQIRIIPNS